MRISLMLKKTIELIIGVVINPIIEILWEKIAKPIIEELSVPITILLLLMSIGIYILLTRPVLFSGNIGGGDESNQPTVSIQSQETEEVGEIIPPLTNTPSTITATSIDTKNEEYQKTRGLSASCFDRIYWKMYNSTLSPKETCINQSVNNYGFYTKDGYLKIVIDPPRRSHTTYGLYTPLGDKAEAEFSVGLQEIEPLPEDGATRITIGVVPNPLDHNVYPSGKFIHFNVSHVSRSLYASIGDWYNDGEISQINFYEPITGSLTVENSLLTIKVQDATGEPIIEQVDLPIRGSYGYAFFIGYSIDKGIKLRTNITLSIENEK